MVARFGDHNYRRLITPVTTEDGRPEALPRRTWYGSTEATSFGLVPVADYPDELPDWEDCKEIITACNERKIFPVYHARAKNLFSHGWSQNGLPYCWAWAAAGAAMTCRASENQRTVQLAPNSLGWLVSWRSQGYYLDATIKGIRERGIAPLSAVSDIYSRNARQFADDWEEQAYLYRVLEWWDTDRRLDERDYIRQCIALLQTGRPLYIAYNWWGHAVQCLGMRWDETERNNIVWEIQNSHGDTDVIELTGRRGVPDEAYCMRSAV